MDNLLQVFWISLAVVAGFAGIQFTVIASRSREPTMIWFALLCYAGLFKLLTSLSVLDAHTVSEVIEVDRWWYTSQMIISVVLIKFLTHYTGIELKRLTYAIYGLIGISCIANMAMPNTLFYASVEPELIFKTFSWGEQIPMVDFEFHPMSALYFTSVILQLFYYVYNSVLLARNGRLYAAAIIATYFIWRVIWGAHESLTFATDTTLLTEIPMSDTSLPLLIVLMAFELSRQAAALGKTQISLQETENQYQQLVEYVGDGYFVIDADSMALADVNQQACTMLGFPRDTLLQFSLGDIAKNKDPNNLRKMLAALEEKVPITLEETFYCSDGSQLPVEVRIGVVTVAGQRLALAMARDNRERIALEEQQRVLEGQIQHSQKLEALGTLSSGIAHDFNNILGAILGFADLALDDPDDRTQTKEYVTNIRDAGLRAKDLVKRILTFSRPADTDARTMRLDSVIDEALVMLKATLPSNIEIQTHYCSGEPSIRADSSQIHQVIVGLCTNSAQAMELSGGVIKVGLDVLTWRGEPTAGISLHLPAGEYIHLTVSDSGPGMSPEIAQRAFDPFFTTKESSNGTGLGLSIVHGIVKNYGGEVYIDPNPGQGAKLHVYLPRANAVDRPDPLPQDSAPTGSESILLVDDNLPLLESLTITLRQLGYVVEPVHSSKTALDLFRDSPERYDLVITDLAMPELTGDELVAAMKETRGDLPVIMCTGYSHSIDQNRMSQLGIDVILNKPVSRSVLAAHIREVVAVANNVKPAE